MSALDHEYTSSCGHTWTIRHTACPQCFADLCAQVGAMEPVLQHIQGTLADASLPSSLADLPGSVERLCAHVADLEAEAKRTDTYWHEAQIRKCDQVEGLFRRVVELEAQLAEARAAAASLYRQLVRAEAAGPADAVAREEDPAP